MFRNIHLFIFEVLLIQMIYGTKLRGSNNAVYYYSRNKYHLGQGSFGEAIAGTKVVGHFFEPVALKFERIASNKTTYVYHEKIIYQKLAGHESIPNYYDCLRDKKGNAVLIIELLGRNLRFYRKNMGGTFSIKTSLMIGIQLITIIEYLHSKNVVFNDLKPDNFAVGYYNTSMIHILDFGLCTFYKENGSHIKQEKREVAAGRGTGGYMSLYAHKHRAQSRRDDLESIVYMLIEFLQGKLPWTFDKTYKRSVRLRKIFNRKSQMKIKNIVGNQCTNTLTTFLRIARALKFKQRPNYQFLRDLLLDELHRHGYSNDLKFEWLNVNIENERPKTNLDDVINQRIKNGTSKVV